MAKILNVHGNVFEFDSTHVVKEGHDEKGFVGDVLLTNVRVLEQDELLVAGQLPAVRKVEFNGPATIVFFEDGTKGVSKCSQCGWSYGKPPCVKGARNPQEDECCKAMGYCKEMGVMVAIAKRGCPNLRKKLQGWCQ